MQLKIMEPLTDPTAHGGDAADTFHLVYPSAGLRVFGQAGGHSREHRPHRACG